MKLELKENMYVRTKNGKIGKLMGYMAFNENKIAILTNTTEKGIKITPVIDKDAIIKASYNIIDILEVGDYVNGQKIINIIPIDICGNEILDNQHIFTKDGEIFENEIKSIVTHEQMEQTAYKVVE